MVLVQCVSKKEFKADWALDNRALHIWAQDNRAPDSWAPGPICPVQGPIVRLEKMDNRAPDSWVPDNWAQTKLLDFGQVFSCSCGIFLITKRIVGTVPQ